MRVGIIKKLVILTVALWMAVAVSASVFVNENFNGLLPTTDWTFSGGATNDGVESVISGTAGGYSLNLDRTAAGLPQARNNISGISGEDAGLELNISFDYNPIDYSAQAHVFILRGNNNSSAAIQLTLSDASGNVKNYGGSSMGTLTESAWYHVEITAVPQNDAGDDTYDLMITDSSGTVVISQTGLDFRTDVTSYDELRWLYNTTALGADGQFYIDNVDVRTTTVAAPTNITSIIDQDFNLNADGFDLVGDTADRTGLESGLTGIGGGVSIDLHDTTNASNPYAQAALVVDNADEPLNVLFDFYVDTGLGENMTFRLKDEDGEGDDGIKLTLNKFDGSGLYNHDGSDFQSLGLTLNEDAWYRFWIVASAESDAVKTYDMTIYTAAGTVVTNYTGLPFKSNIDSYDSIRWYYNNLLTSKGDRFYVDNVIVGTTIPATATPASLWQDWLSEFVGGMGDATNMLDDADGDLLDNLGEYAFGGIPTNASDRGNTPVQSMVLDGGSNYLEYVYYMLDDAGDRGLSYSLETDTDLVNAPGWTNANYEVTGTNTATGISGFNAVSNRIPTDVKDKQFINLKVEFAP